MKCTACYNGNCERIGSLGDLNHYRCRNCGCGHSRRVSRVWLTVINDRPVESVDIPKCAGAAVRRGNRKVLFNRWGNLVCYVSGRRVTDFAGEDTFAAADWLNGVESSVDLNAPVRIGGAR